MAATRLALIAVGTELLRFGRRDTNADWLAERLQRLGIEVASRTIVGDERMDIVAAVRAGLERADGLILTGGLGPTEDDRTRDALAEALGLPLDHDAEAEAWLRETFAARRLPFGAEQVVQARLPRGGRWIDNPLGSARGIHLRHGEREVFALPGVPSEMRATFSGGVEPALPRQRGAVARRTLKIAGRTESSVDRELSPLYAAHPVSATILIGREGIEVHLFARDGDRTTAVERIERFERDAAKLLGPDLYGRDGATLPEVVGRALERRGETVAVAESCTAGLLAAAFTEVPGASAWFRGGFVVYHDALKTELAAVDPALVEREGAVSEAVCRALARGARERAASSWGIGITGIAGPSGATAQKPVGLVHVSWSDRNRTKHAVLRLIGDRRRIRRRSVVEALDGLRRLLVEAPGG